MKVTSRRMQSSLTLNGGRVPYYPYYIDRHWNEDAQDRLSMMQKIVSQWADELDRAKDGQKLFLPYSLNDQEVECFEAVESHSDAPKSIGMVTQWCLTI